MLQRCYLKWLQERTGVLGNIDHQWEGPLQLDWGSKEGKVRKTRVFNHILILALTLTIHHPHRHPFDLEAQAQAGR